MNKILKPVLGFLGSYTVKQENGYVEPKNKTKRFRVYQKAILDQIGIETFTHQHDDEHSTYLMISNKNTSVDAVKEKAKKMFNELFPELED